MKKSQPKGRELIEAMNRLTLPDGMVALWFLGQSGFAAKGGGNIVYFDPYLSDYLEKFTKDRPDEDPRHVIPPLAPEDVTNADVVFGSHWHYDHIDPGTVGVISKNVPDCRFVAPPSAHDDLIGYGIPDERIISPPADTWETAGNIAFTCIPAAHEELEYNDTTGFRYYGYVVKLGNINIYHAGDCIPYDGLIERLKSLEVNIALLPINGRDYFRLNRGFKGNFTYREAGELARAIEADLLIPMHFGMHLANTERPGNLVDFLVENIPEQQFHIMNIGESIIFTKQKSSLRVFMSDNK